MLQRNELKFALSNKDLLFFKKKFTLFKTFPQRKIFSIYFDTFHLNDFNDSEEGSVPRKKIRLRYYDVSSKDFNKTSILNGNLEIKKTFDSYRSKQKIAIKDNLLNSIRTACNYGTTKRHPVCAISYTRNYYKYIDGTRLTIDKNIMYFPIKDSLPTKYSFIENNRIIEMKIENINCNKSLHSDYLDTFRIRFSKYCEAIKKINYL
tara:strand:- start:234 stop:851 length:618 start_codon:yes stop_codon:yes gene_type:complete